MPLTTIIAPFTIAMLIQYPVPPPAEPCPLVPTDGEMQKHLELCLKDYKESCHHSK